MKKRPRFSVDFAGLNHVPPRKGTAHRDVFYREKIRTPLHGVSWSGLTRPSTSLFAWARDLKLHPGYDLRHARDERGHDAFSDCYLLVSRRLLARTRFP